MSKLFWLLLGGLCTLLGVLGLLLPLVPGVLFLAGAAACFDRARGGTAKDPKKLFTKSPLND